MKKLTKFGLLALASLTFSGPAWAITAGSNDLILSFRSNGYTDGSADLEVDLGAYTQFELGGTGFTNNTATELNVKDLTTIFGANWATDGSIVFSVAGDTQTLVSGNKVGFVTQGDDGPSGAGAQNDTSAFSGAVSLFDTLRNKTGSYSATANSTGAVEIPNTNGTVVSGSYTYEEAHGSTAQSEEAFGYFTRTSGFTNLTNLSDIEAQVQDTNGVTSTVLDLYSYDSSDNPTLEGAFTLGSNGSLSYAVAPEPSTWALMFSGLGLMFLAVRRRWISILG